MSAEPDEDVIELATRLFAMAREGRAEELATYLEAGVPADLTNDKGDSLVMLAAYHGHADAVRVLLARGADPDRLNDRGQSPLAGAVFKAEVEVIEALMQGGADTEAGSPTASQTAAMFNNPQVDAALGR